MATKQIHHEAEQIRLFGLTEAVWPAGHPKEGILLGKSGPYDANLVVDGHICQIELKTAEVKQKSYFYSNKGYAKLFNNWMGHREVWIFSDYNKNQRTSANNLHYVLFRKPQFKLQSVPSITDIDAANQFWEQLGTGNGQPPVGDITLDPPQWVMCEEGMEDEYPRMVDKWLNGNVGGEIGVNGMNHIRGLLDKYVPATHWANRKDLQEGYDRHAEKGTKIDVRPSREFVETNGIACRPGTTDLVDAIRRQLNHYGSL